MKISTFAKQSGQLLQHHAPAILTGISVLGTFSTAFAAVKATPEALRRISAFEVAKNEGVDQGTDWLKATPLEVVKVTWTAYIPAAVIGGATVACILGANGIHAKRQAALVAGYTILEKGYQEYKSEVVEAIGKAKETEVVDNIAKKNVEKAVHENREVIVTGNGTVLCHDHLSGRLFRGDYESLRKAMNDINAQCINDGYASQNDFYELIGLPGNGYGEEFGWTTDNPLDLIFTSVMVENDGKKEPAMSLNYRTAPKPGFYSFG